MNQPITLPLTLLKRLERLATETRHTPQSIIKQAVTEKLDYEEWKLRQIDEGLAELKAGKGIPDAEFWARIGTVSNARKKTA